MFLSFSKIKSRGSALLLALLVVTAILGAALSLATMVISSIKRGTLAAYALKAYYMAESGIERGLYSARKDKQIISSGACDLFLPPANFNCQRQVYYLKEAIYPALRKNQTVQLNLLNPSGDIAANVNSVKIVCSDPDVKVGSNPTWLQVNIIEIGDDWVIQPWVSETFEILKPCDGHEFLIGISFSIDSSYILKLKALYDNASNLKIIAYDSGDRSLDLATQLFLDSQGEYKSSRQKISVQMPNQIVALGYFDYVLFSEQDLDKVQPAPPPPPPPPPPGNNNNGG